MKKILLLLAFPISVFGQKVTTYYDSVGRYYYCKINPIIVPGDTITRLKISTFDDNQVDYTAIYFNVITEKSKSMFSGNFYLTPDEYQAWTDKSYIFNYVATKLQLTIK